MMRILLIWLMTMSLIANVSATENEESEYKSTDLSLAGNVLIGTGVVFAFVGGAIKFKKIDRIDIFGRKIKTEREYSPWNYVLISTGASCFVVGTTLLISSRKSKPNRFGIRYTNDGIMLLAQWHF